MKIVGASGRLLAHLSKLQGHRSAQRGRLTARGCECNPVLAHTVAQGQLLAQLSAGVVIQSVQCMCWMQTRSLVGWLDPPEGFSDSPGQIPLCRVEHRRSHIFRWSWLAVLSV